MAVIVDDTLAFLLGSWSINRVIDDHRDASRSRFTGVAHVTAAGAGADYSEAGRMQRGSHVGPARRRLQFADRGDGTVRVDFQDGRPFLDLDLAEGRCVATHPCRADTYEMGFEVLGPDRIRETWRVSGPEKDYAAETIWQRL
jgi:hypothetical protein